MLEINNIIKKEMLLEYLQKLGYCFRNNRLYQIDK